MVQQKSVSYRRPRERPSTPEPPPRGYPRAVLWDMDGVLADTQELHYLTWRRICGDFGIRVTRRQYAPLFGVSVEETLAGLLGPTCEPALAAEIRRRKDALYFEVAPTRLRRLPGALTWLRRFAPRCRQAVASLAPPDYIELNLECLGLRSYFQAIVSSGERLPAKPDPAVFLTAAAELGVAPADCLVIEDTPQGIEAGRRAGMRVIAVCTSNPARALTGADLVLPDLTRLTEKRLAKVLGENRS